MSCHACATSKADPMNDRHWRNGCGGCKARALAATGAHIESSSIGAMTPQYRQVLEKMFGDQWERGAADVAEWAALIEAAARRARAAVGKKSTTEKA